MLELTLSLRNPPDSKIVTKYPNSDNFVGGTKMSLLRRYIVFILNNLFIREDILACREHYARTQGSLPKDNYLK